MVLGKHGMCRIRRVVVPEDDKLFLFATLDDLRRSSRKFCFDLIDDWNDERSYQRKDKEVDLI